MILEYNFTCEFAMTSTWKQMRSVRDEHECVSEYRKEYIRTD